VNSNAIPPGAQLFLNAINQYFFNPLFLLLFAVGLLVFVWGVFEFLWKFSNSQRKEDGKRHMLYGVGGMFVMSAAYALVHIIAGLFGIQL
jgi:heme/copper-type cytochrome/quinol oxidase subunit 2